MTEEEKSFLEDKMTSYGLSDAERREIVSQLVDAASADGKLSSLEMDVVKRVTKALGV